MGLLFSGIAVEFRGGRVVTVCGFSRCRFRTSGCEGWRIWGVRFKARVR